MTMVWIRRIVPALFAVLVCVGQSASQPTSSDERFLGIWSGTLNVGGGQSLRVAFTIERDSLASLKATMSSPDQGATNIPVDAVSVRGDSVTVGVAVIGGSYEGTLTDSNAAIIGQWSQSGMRFVLNLERVDNIEMPNRPQVPDRPLPYEEEEVRIHNEDSGLILAGTLTIPSREAPYAAVVLISGSGGQNRDSEVFGHKLFLVLSDYLTKQGIAVLRFDDRGIGGSDGDFSAATTLDFADDVAAAVSYLRTRPDIEGIPVGLYGHSEGGLIATIVASDITDIDLLVLAAAPGMTGEEIIMGQVLWQVEQQLAALSVDENSDVLGPSLHEAKQRASLAQQEIFDIIKEEPDHEIAAQKLRDVLLEQFPAGPVPDEVDIEAIIDGQVSQLNSPWMRQFLTLDPLPALGQVTCPVLAIGGSKDVQVVSSDNLPLIEEALVSGGNTDVTIHQFEGLNHLFQTAETGAVVEYATIEETMAPVALDLIGGWIKSVTRGR